MLENLPALAARSATHILMSLDTPLAELVLEGGSILAAKFLNNHLLPVGVHHISSLKKWFESRRIPASREHLEYLELKTGLSLGEIIQKSLGLSLSDSFWVKPARENLTWGQVNFFTNDFSDDIGEYLMMNGGEIGSLISPSNTTDGVVAKKWIIRNGIRYLVKRGSNEQGWQHLNEVMAYRIAKALELNCVPYFILGEDTCACPCFVKPGQNLVSAFDYLGSIGLHISGGHSSKEYYQPLREVLGKEWLDAMLLLDYIIMNRDRHLKNFCLLQDAQNGQLLGPAPIFDSGSSLFHIISFGRELPFENIKAASRPFCKTHDEQILLASLEPFKARLKILAAKIPDMVADVYDKSPIRREYIDGLGLLLRERVKGLV